MTPFQKQLSLVVHAIAIAVPPETKIIRNASEDSYHWDRFAYLVSANVSTGRNELITQRLKQITQSLIVRTAQAHMSWLSEFLFPTSIALDSNAGAPERGARGAAAPLPFH